ncbi:MAG: hypothetical protein LBD30_05395, partial [Verrucomicrobiales bacterium]|nr:hypothetical protein [Verrucomicrobiales bacterium]
MKNYLGFILTVALLTSGPTWADTYTKADNTDPLTAATSWVSGSVPGAGDIALWDNSLITPNNSALDTDWTVGQLKIATTASGAHVTVSGTHTLTLNGVGGTGIDMTGVTSAHSWLYLDSNVTLGAAQTWTLASRLFLRGNLSGNQALTITGTGDLDLNGDNSGFTGGLTLATSAKKTLTINHLNALGAGAINVSQDFVFVTTVTNLNLANAINLNNKNLEINTNGRDVLLSSNILTGSGNIAKTNNNGTLTISGTNNFSLNKLEVTGGHVILSGSLYSTGIVQLESANNTSASTGTLTITGVLDRKGANNADIRSLSTNGALTINITGSGLLNTREGGFNMGAFYGNSATSTLNVNLNNSAAFTATNSNVSIGGQNGMTSNLSLSGTSLFHVNGLSLNNNANTSDKAAATVSVTVSDQARLLSNGDFNIGANSSNTVTSVTQNGGVVQAPIFRLNGSADKENNLVTYHLNGGVLYLSDKNDTPTNDHNLNTGNSSIGLGKDSALYLTSGTIRVNGTNNGINGNASAGTNSGTGRLVVQEGGVTFDNIISGNFSVNVALEHGGAADKDGGLTKTGAGVLLLNTANTYTGDT